jgi:hypothetical protein
MPKLRYQPPERLQGSTDYSKHDALRGSLNTVRLAREQAWSSSGLRSACDLSVNHGRKREPGRWELAAVAFVASRHVDLQPWWDESTDELWRECGFTKKPPYNRVWERLRELGEERDEAFLDATEIVIQRCIAHDPNVFAHAHVDSTEDETHAALQHDCQPGESCARAEDNESGVGGSSAQGSALRPQRAPTSQAREQREEWNEEDPAEAEQHAREAGPEATEDIDKGKRIRVGGCWFRTRDSEAGTRAYTRNGKTTRFWHGYYSAKAVDAYTGGVIPSVDPANKQEYDVFPELMDRVCKLTGKTPQTVTGDKGYAVEKCYKYATRKGIAPVFPWRGGDRERKDHPTHDRDGVKRCDHCGGEMKQTRFAIEKGKTKETPWLWFKCAAPATPACAGEQRIRCETDWRSLVPLSRLNPVYHELLKSHYEYEGVHDYWRDRYRVAADTLALRPKVVSMNWHRLRANVACFIDWLRIAAVNGWLGSARAAKRGRNGVRTKVDAAAKAVAELIKDRSNAGLDLPYGPGAAALGLGETMPPSARSSGDPPGP